MKDPNGISGVIDAPFFSHIRHDGAKTLICTRDNSWSTGQVQVHDLVTKEVKAFDAANGHIEMDVDFQRRRIVLTGTSKGLLLTDFDGKVLANAKEATLQRNACVEFSPSGNRVLVGSWDNTVSVFEIVE